MLLNLHLQLCPDYLVQFLSYHQLFYQQHTERMHLPVRSTPYRLVIDEITARPVFAGSEDLLQPAAKPITIVKTSKTAKTFFINFPSIVDYIMSFVPSAVL